MSAACRADGRSKAFARRHPAHPALSFHWTVVEPNPPPATLGLGLAYADDLERIKCRDLRTLEPDDDGHVECDNDDIAELFTSPQEALERRKWVSWGGGKTRPFYVYERVG